MTGNSMKTYISMLRAINVGGQNKIPMLELKQLCETLSFTGVATYVQSGNVVFDSNLQEPGEVAARIEARLEGAYGAKISVFVRTPADFRRILDGNPFLTGRNETSTFLHVTFLYRAPTPAQWAQLKGPEGTGDEFFPDLQEVFLFCPAGYGRTKLNNSFFERRLSIPATTRNWNTVRALYKLSTER